MQRHLRLGLIAADITSTSAVVLHAIRHNDDALLGATDHYVFVIPYVSMFPYVRMNLYVHGLPGLRPQHVSQDFLSTKMQDFLLYVLHLTCVRMLASTPRSSCCMFRHHLRLLSTGGCRTPADFTTRHRLSTPSE